MSNNIRAVKGCKDLFFDQSLKLSHIVQVSKEQAFLHSCSEIFTPIIEHTEVFSRGLGNFSDILNKEMYSFIDKGKHHLTLRPEFTAGIIRAVLSNNLHAKLPLKFFSWGPLFRRENPQSGRQRQFNQINVEFIGFAHYLFDAEIIKLADDILQKLDIKNYRLEINSLGCSLSRKNYQKALFEYFNDQKNLLSAISQTRLVANPLRILDSKEVEDIKLVANAPSLKEFYTQESLDHFEHLLEYLDLLKINYQVNYRIVRGLDYYNHTVFEFISDTLGAKSTLIGGGRYDGLSELMGGKPLPAIGFAGGIERLMIVHQKSIELVKPVIIIPITDKEKPAALIAASILRQNNIPCLIEFGSKVGDILQRAINKYNPDYAIMIGEDEIAKNMYTLKDLNRFSQELLLLGSIIEILKKSYV